MKTPLYDCHLKANAKMIDFAGWEMPLHYGSQIQEHHQVRQDAGVFDVSHMTIVDIKGKEVESYLRYLLANNIDRLIPGKALYTCMLNERGGIIDDGIIYKISSDFYRFVINSATHDKDLAWLQKHSKNFKIEIEERFDLAMLAIQGLKSREKITHLFSNTDAAQILELKPFHFVTLGDLLVARTGYTGEDGFEIILSAKESERIWKNMLEAHIAPAGLGARDTLRLEAGLNLYGSDMDESVTPFESNLAWTVALNPETRYFIGRDALEKQLQLGVERKLVGLVLDAQGVLRNHQKVIVDDVEQGEITSGSFSPTLNKGIALARVSVGVGAYCFVEMRGKQVRATVVKLPFVRDGEKTF